MITIHAQFETIHPLLRGTMPERPDWIHTSIDQVRAEREGHGRPWQESIRVLDLFTAERL